MIDKEYSQFVRNNADKSKMYDDVLKEITGLLSALIDPDPKNTNEATIEVKRRILCKYIVQLVNDMVCLVGEEHGREESEDAIRDQIGLSVFNRYNKHKE